MTIDMNIHWIMVLILLSGAFVANHFFNLDDESRLRKYTFYSLLFLTFVTSGAYLFRVIWKLPEWNILEILGFALSAIVFTVSVMTYRLMWNSRSRK